MFAEALGPMLGPDWKMPERVASWGGGRGGGGGSMFRQRLKGHLGAMLYRALGESLAITREPLRWFLTPISSLGS